jgi:hypothetical protein
MLELPTANTTAGTYYRNFLHSETRETSENKPPIWILPSPPPMGHCGWLRKQVVGQLSCGGPLGLVEKATNLHNLLAPNDSLILPPISTCHFGHLTTQSCHLFPIFSFLAIFPYHLYHLTYFCLLTIYRLIFTFTPVIWCSAPTVWPAHFAI